MRRWAILWGLVGFNPLLAVCHTGGCLAEMSPTEQAAAIQAKQAADEFLLLALACGAIGFLLLWGRQLTHDRQSRE